MRKTTTNRRPASARKLAVKDGCDRCQQYKTELQIAASIIADMVATMYPGVISCVSINDGEVR